MLTLKVSAGDIGQDIKNCILSSRQKKSKSTKTDEETPMNLRLINEEKDGNILFSFEEQNLQNSFQPHLNAKKMEEVQKVLLLVQEAPKTCLGLFCPDSKSYKVLWTFTQVEYIASCSINQLHNLIAFTILNKNEEEFEGYGIYTAFLAEISEPNRLFSLNIERVNFLKVQFLHLTTEPGHGNETLEREAYMLVFLHKESIVLYHIPLARAGEDAMIMKRQPEKEQLTGEFFWCSWDVDHQCLHYIYNQHDNEDVNYRNCQTILSTLQFGFNGKYDSMIDVPLNLPFPLDSKTSFPSYIDIPFCTGIPDRSLNVEVMTLTNGTFCVCYQPTLSTETVHSEKGAEKVDQTFDVVYFICMVHHVHTLQGTVSKAPYEATYRRLIFTWYNGYLVVCLPGFFVHMLNVNIEYEPCNHILLHEGSLFGEICPVTSSKSMEVPPETQVCESKPVHHSEKDDLIILHPNYKKLQLVTHYSKGNYASGWTLYDRKKSIFYKLKLNKKYLIDLFKNCYLSTTRMAIFHYIILHERDYNVTKKVFESLGNDCASPEVQEIFSEFLISTTYLKMRRRVYKNVLSFVPFTTFESFRGQYEKGYTKEILAKIQYHVLPSLRISKKTSKECIGNFYCLWDTLRQHLNQNQIMQLQFTRFSPTEIIQHKVSLLKNQNIDNSKSSFMDGDTFLNKLIYSPIYRNQETSSSESDADLSISPNLVETAFGVVPSFLKNKRLTPEYGIIIQLMKDTFMEFLIKYLKCEPQLKLENIAKEYVACQLHQALQLCHIVWSIKKVEENKPLNKAASQSEYELFQLFERISMALKEQTFPITEGFCTYFTALGFQCLPQNQFLSYIDSGVLILTNSFINQLMNDLKDEDQFMSLKYQIIMRLPEKMVLSCCQKWNHPYATSFFTIFNVQEMLLSKTTEWGLLAEDQSEFSSSQNSEKNDYSVPKQSFYPLSAFMNHLNDNNDSNEEAIELPGRRQLHETALCHTSQETDCDLGVVNF